MTKVIFFDYCAFIIELLIITSVFLRGLTKGRVNRHYIAIGITLFVATLFDIIGMRVEIKGPAYASMTFLANTISLWTTAMLGVLICGYLFARTNIWYMLQKSRLFKTIYYMPFIINTILVFVINPFNGIIFYVDADGMYARGEGISLLYILSLVYVYIGTCVVIKYISIYSVRKTISIFLLLGSSLIATLIQVLFPNVIIQMYVTACAALILLLEVQAPEERIHAGTGLFSLNAYVNDVRDMFCTGVSFDATVAVITNYSAIVEMLGYFNAMNVIELVSKRLEDSIKALKVDADIYYLDDGRFAVIHDFRYSDRNFEIAQGINRTMNRDVQLGDTLVKVLSNVCTINCPKDIDDPDFLIAADEELFKIGYTGELRYAEKLFSKREFELHKEFTRIIDRAFDNGYIDIYYQPIYSILQERYVGAEAFIRLNDPEYGYIDPGLVITEAEKHSVIHRITTFEIEEACKLIAECDRKNVSIEHVEINLSPLQCMWGDITNVMLTKVREHTISPDRICINITDIDNYELYSKMNDNLRILDQVGFAIIMDDFGSGVFEIERVVEMPLKGIKLDRFFVKNGFSVDNMSVLKGTVKMIKDIGIEAGAVGVENKDMLDELVKLGCTNIQGYYYCRPLSKKELMSFLAQY